MKIYGKETKINGDKKNLNTYSCVWCEHQFKMFVGTGTAKVKTVSSQVICPRCGNLLKTR